MALIFIRTVILYVAVIFSVRLMGKRQIGELQPTELVITILISIFQQRTEKEEQKAILKEELV